MQARINHSERPNGEGRATEERKAGKGEKEPNKWARGDAGADAKAVSIIRLSGNLPAICFTYLSVVRARLHIGP